MTIRTVKAIRWAKTYFNEDDKIIQKPSLKDRKKCQLCQIIFDAFISLPVQIVLSSELSPQSEIPLHTLSDDMHSSFAHRNAWDGQLASGNSMNKNIENHETDKSIHIFNDM